MKQKEIDTTNTHDDHCLTAVFGDVWEAEKAYGNVLKRGYSKDDVDIFVAVDSENRQHEEPVDTEANKMKIERGKYLSLSSAIGALLGIITGLGLAVGFIIAGYFIGQIAGAITASVISVIIGTILGTTSSVTTDEDYKPEKKKNGIAIRINPRNNDDVNYFKKDWKTHKGKVMAVPG